MNLNAKTTHERTHFGSLMVAQRWLGLYDSPQRLSVVHVLNPFDIFIIVDSAEHGFSTSWLIVAARGTFWMRADFFASKPFDISDVNPTE